MQTRTARASRLALALIAAGLTAPSGAAGAVCNVPTGYPTIAAALAAPACDPIQIAAGTYTENLFVGRDVTVAGAGSAATTVAGWITVADVASDVTIGALRVDATAASALLCDASGLWVHNGARAGGLDLVVVGKPAIATPCHLFDDGFESGNLSAWSAHP